MADYDFTPKKSSTPPLKRSVDLGGLKPIPMPEVTPLQEKKIVEVARSHGYHERGVGADGGGDSILKERKNSAVEVVVRRRPRVIVGQLNVTGDVTIINAFIKYTNDHRFGTYLEAIADLMKNGPRPS